MDEDTWRNRRTWALVGVGIAILAVAVLTLTGGQTATILSTVGAAIPDHASGGSTGSDTGSGSGGTAGSDSGSSGGGQVADAAAGPPTLLIVRTGTLELEVASLETTMTAASNLVGGAGGYVSASNETAAGSKTSATVVYRIPAASWDATLVSLRGLATVRHQQVDTEEVSGQVVDLGARITNLRATEAALQAIMARASKISDVLDVQQQLTTTRGEIERLVADKATLEGRAAYGSLKVTFALPAPAAVDTAQKGWDPAADVDQATGKLIRLGQKATSAGIFLAIVGLPVLISGAIGLFVAWQLYRLGRRLIRRGSPEAGLPG
jgi:hypothetical protein